MSYEFRSRGDDDDDRGSKIDEVKSLIVEQGEAWQDFKQRNEAEIKAMRKDIDGILTKNNRPSWGGGESSSLSEDGTNKLAGAIKSLLCGEQAKAEKLFSEVVERKAMIAGSDPDGGYLIIPSFTANVSKIAAEISPVSEMARTVNLETGLMYEEPMDSDNSMPATWVGETTPRTDTATPQLKQFTCQLNELSVMPKASQTLIDTSGRDIIGWLEGKVGDAFGLAESAAFHSGNGVAKPRGFLTYPVDTADDASRAWGKIQIVTTGASGAFHAASSTINQGDCLQQLIGKLKVQYRRGAGWLMSRETAALVSQLKDATTGRWIWVDSLIQGQPSTLLGYPVEISEDMPQVGADTFSIMFGNLAKAYTIVRKAGVKFLMDPYTDKPNVRLYAYERVGGGVHNFEAIKLLQFSA